MDCWCERGKLQRERSDTGLVPDVWALVISFNITLMINLIGTTRAQVNVSVVYEKNIVSHINYKTTIEIIFLVVLIINFFKYTHIKKNISILLVRLTINQ
jgi:hypothetical protein